MSDTNPRQGNHQEDRSTGSLARAFIIVAIAVLVAVAAILYVATPAKAAHLTRVAVSTTQPALARVVMVTAADLAVALSASPNPGEGMIRLTTRICGTAATWQANAAANGVQPPYYVIYLGQALNINCGAAAVAPAAVQAAPSSGWVNPVCATAVGDNLGAGRNHKGVDLAAPHGREIRAAAAGTVSTHSNFYQYQDRFGVWRTGGAGYYSTINHGGGVYTHYFHQSRHAVWSGWVNAGQVIGYVGSTGGSSGPHLHFEVRVGGPWAEGFGTGIQDPVRWMNNRGVRLGC